MSDIEVKVFAELPSFTPGSIWSDQEWFACLLGFGPSAKSEAFGYYEGEDCFYVVSKRRVLKSLTNYFSIRIETEIKSNEFFGSLFRLWHSESWTKVELDYVVGLQESRRISRSAEKAGFKVIVQPRYENWYHLMDQVESFTDYISLRPSRLRNTLRRRQRRLKELGSRVIVWTNESDGSFENIYGDYEFVYHNSWKQGEEFPQFVREFAMLCARRGILRLGVLYLNNKPAAAQFWVTQLGTAFIYKLAYDEELAHLSVGACLSQVMFEYAIDEDRVNCIDYGIGGEPYKKDWVDLVRPVQRIHAYNPQGPIDTVKYNWHTLRS